MYTEKINIKNQVHYHYKKLIKPKKIETRNSFINKTNFKDLVIYFTRCHPGKSIKMFNLYFDELIDKNEECERKKMLDG